MQTNYLVKASEINDYIYCKRAWWLKRKGLSETTTDMLEGQIKHQSLFNIVNLYRILKILIIILLSLVVVTGILYFGFIRLFPT